MNCWRVQNLIAPFLDGELPDPEQEAITAHLSECSECADLVEAVDALPPVQRLDVDPDTECKLFAEFDSCLKERIARSFFPDVEEVGAADGTTSAPSILAALSRGQVRLPAALVAAYVGVVLLLGGGIALNYQKVGDLEASVRDRDEIINAMSDRLAAAETADFPILAETAASDRGIVFLPAGAASATGLPTGVLPGIQPASFQIGATGIPSNPYRRATYDSSPRLVH